MDYPEQRSDLNQEYYDFFIQTNANGIKTHVDYGLGIKLSNLRLTRSVLTRNVYDLPESDFEGKSVLFLAPTFNFNYKLLKNKNLIFNSQVGVSAALHKLKVEKKELASTSSKTVYLSSYIVRVGIQYKFKIK